MMVQRRLFSVHSFTNASLAIFSSLFFSSTNNKNLMKAEAQSNVSFCCAYAIRSGFAFFVCASDTRKAFNSFAKILINIRA